MTFGRCPTSPWYRSNLTRRDRAAEFRKFLAKIDAEVPEGLEVRLVCGNYPTHKTPVVKT